MRQTGQEKGGRLWVLNRCRLTSNCKSQKSAKFVKCKMIRHYIRRTERCMYPDGYILKAVKKVVAEKKKKYVMFPKKPPSQKDFFHL